MKKAPVHRINEFRDDHHEHHTDFYVNTLEQHVSSHPFVDEPHKHDFFVCVIFTKGSGTHFIDFKKYQVKPGAVFFLNPGQMHHWQLTPDTRGFIFFHSAGFYNLYYQQLTAHHFPFYQSLYQRPVMYTSNEQQKKVTALVKELLAENISDVLFNREKRCALTTLIYIELSRGYKAGKKNEVTSDGYQEKVRKLEELIEQEYKTEKSPAAYADRMGMTRRHLNRICQEGLGKTVSEMIADRIILEAKRLLVQGGLNVGQVADDLGYYDHSYFNRFFKRHVGKTPLDFIAHTSAISA